MSDWERKYDILRREEKKRDTFCKSLNLKEHELLACKENPWEFFKKGLSKEELGMGEETSTEGAESQQLRTSPLLDSEFFKRGYGEKAVLDTIMLDAVRTVRNLRDYIASLSKKGKKKGKIYLTTAIVRELQKHGLINKLVDFDMTGKGGGSTQMDFGPIEHKLFDEIGHDNRFEGLKQEIVDLINFEFKKPQIDLENIEILKTKEDLIKKLGEEAVKIRKRDDGKKYQLFTKNEWRDQVPFGDKSIIAAIVEKGAPVIISEDGHFRRNLGRWQQLVKTKWKSDKKIKSINVISSKEKKYDY